MRDELAKLLFEELLEAIGPEKMAACLKEWRENLDKWQEESKNNLEEKE